MPRARKSRPQKATTDPLGLTVRTLALSNANPSTTNLHTTKILPVIRNLSALEAGQRTEAVTAITNLVEDPACRKLLLKERIVQTLMERTLNDSAQEVVVRGWGALRNLAVEEGYDVCMHMYRKDILTPATAAIIKVRRVSTCRGVAS